MPGEYDSLRNVPVSDLVDYMLPFSRLLTLARTADSIQKKGKIGDDSGVVGDLRKITMSEGAHTFTWGIDVVVFSPTQRKPIEIQHGSDFDLRDFLCLGDKQLNRALKRVGDLPNDVPRGTFSEAMVTASVLIQGITLSHGLDRKALFRVIEHHSLPGFLYYLDHSEGKFLNLRQRVLLLYGCMKILANRLDYSSKLNQGQ